jgi:hypothetical protein
MANRPEPSCTLHGPRGALACKRCRAKLLASGLGGILGLIAWVVTLSASWLFAIFGPDWRRFGAEWQSLAELGRDLALALSELPSAILEGEYGYQFAMLSAYLWIGVGAIGSYLAVTGRWRSFRLRSQLVAVLVVGLMIGSVRWLVSEVSRVDRVAGYPSGRHFFEQGVSPWPLVALSLAVLVLLWRARTRGRPVKETRKV